MRLHADRRYFYALGANLIQCATRPFVLVGILSITAIVLLRVNHQYMNIGSLPTSITHLV